MSAPSPTPEPAPDVPRVLLFGHRGAGKSALVGALLQAGQTQGETLRGEVVHSSVDLPRIRDAVYAGTKLDPYKTDLVSYSVRLRPWRVGTKPVGDPLTVVLDDCDGIAAEALLEQPEPITQRAPGSPVARAVVEADAIVLLVDGASTDDELREAFKDFDAFLNVVHRAKTDARVVGGFPVYLVLTQCDRLARPGDTLASWERHVQERVDYAWAAFDAHLKDADPEGASPSPFLSFGSVDLTVLASAIRRPPLPGSTAPTHHPYQVAELFRDCFTAARAHHERARASEKRLKWTVRLALTTVTFLLLSLATVALFPPRPTGTELADRVRLYLAGEPPAAVRLADGDIERNRTTLLRFQTDAAYGTLEPDLKDFVESRIKEIEAYKGYRAKVRDAAAPGDLRTSRELSAMRTALASGELAPPPQYDWHDTAAVRLRDKWLADCTAVEGAEAALVASYNAHTAAALGHMLSTPLDARWLARWDEIVAAGDRDQFALDTVVPGSQPIDHPRGRAVTYRDVTDYDGVYTARGSWEQARTRVTAMRDLADALGLFAAPNRREAVLAIPKDGPVDPAGRLDELLPRTKDVSQLLADLKSDDRGTREAARAKLAELRGRVLPTWEVWNFAAAGPDLARKLEESFDAGVLRVRALFGTPDTVAGWTALAAKLDQPQFRDWGKLLQVLARLQRAYALAPDPPDPVSDLARFLTDLDTKTFELNATGFTLTVPQNLLVGLDNIDPTAQTLTLTVGTGDRAQTAKYRVKKGELRTVQGGDKPQQSAVYALEPDGTTKLNYRPGDGFRAVLPVKAGSNQLELVWDSGGTQTFQFTRLLREPRLTGRATGTGVTLVPTNSTAVPALPVLLPR